mgnify:CR=1 FL=1
MTIKLMAIDIDGTLVNARKELTPAVRQAIQRARHKGKKVVICTGRPLAGAKSYLSALGLDQTDDEYVVSYNGAVVETTSGQVIFKKGLDYAEYLDLETISRKLKLHFQAVGLKRIYTANRDIGKWTLYNSRIVDLGVSYRTTDEMRAIPIIKCMFVDDPEYLDERLTSPLFQTMASRVIFSKTEPFYYEATAAGVTKGTGLAQLTQHLGLTADEVMAIGDEANDATMIRYAGYGVAMGNAVPVTKAEADFITADCEHDGVAVAINRVLA